MGPIGPIRRHTPFLQEPQPMSSRLRRPLWGLLLPLAAGFLALCFSGGGETPARQFRRPPRPAPGPVPNFPPNVVKHGFPTARFDPAEPEKSDTAWEIEW